MSIESVMPPNHLILFHPLLLPSILPSIRVFSSDLALHIRWPKYWSFSSSPAKEYSVLISLRIDWLDLLEVQGVLKSLLQHHNSKASILQHSAFFTVQLSHPYMTTGKTIKTYLLYARNYWTLRVKKWLSQTSVIKSPQFSHPSSLSPTSEICSRPLCNPVVQVHPRRCRVRESH